MQEQDHQELAQHLFKQIRRLEIKTRRIVNTSLAGDYQAAFKGNGLEFDEVRPYQAGDDVRTIDWNVSARMGQLYVKLFKEEREQSLFVLFDISRSEEFGKAYRTKRNVGAEIAALFAFAALKNQDKFGLATFTDKIEQYYKPKRGRKHILKIIRNVLQKEEVSPTTNISGALKFLMLTLRQRCILVIISDFIDERYKELLVQLHRKHELILIRLYHPLELTYAETAILPVEEIESGTFSWVNVANQKYGQHMNRYFNKLNEELTLMERKYGIDYASINVEENYVSVLEKLLLKRTHKKVRSK